MTPEECTTWAEIQVGEHICNHPDRDLQNPYGMIYCKNLLKYGTCPRGCGGGDKEILIIVPDYMVDRSSEKDLGPGSHEIETEETPIAEAPVCKCPPGCTKDCAGCQYNWDENDRELGFI